VRLTYRGVSGDFVRIRAIDELEAAVSVEDPLHPEAMLDHGSELLTSLHGPCRLGRIDALAQAVVLPPEELDLEGIASPRANELQGFGPTQLHPALFSAGAWSPPLPDV